MLVGRDQRAQLGAGFLGEEDGTEIGDEGGHVVFAVGVGGIGRNELAVRERCVLEEFGDRIDGGLGEFHRAARVGADDADDGLAVVVEGILDGLAGRGIDAGVEEAHAHGLFPFGECFARILGNLIGARALPGFPRDEGRETRSRPERELAGGFLRNGVDGGHAQ